MTTTDQPKPWLTGRPYYCNSCGLGGGEVFACEDGDCEMESEADAIARRDAAAPSTTPAE
jgi:hypothetical protein